MERLKRLLLQFWHTASRPAQFLSLGFLTLGGFVGGLALGWAGFVASDVAQGVRPGPEVADGIRMWAAIIIMAGAVLGPGLVYFFPPPEHGDLQIVSEAPARPGGEVTLPLRTAAPPRCVRSTGWSGSSRLAG